MIKKLSPINGLKTVTELNPPHTIRQNPNRLREVIQTLRKFNRGRPKGRIKRLIIKKIIEIKKIVDKE
jgi:hypothetical protein